MDLKVMSNTPTNNMRQINTYDERYIYFNSLKVENELLALVLNTKTS